MTKTRWYVTASVVYWDNGDYTEVSLDHYSKEETAQDAEDDAREVWAEHGYNPENVIVKPY